MAGIVFINSAYSQGKITRYPPKGATFDCNFANKAEIINGIKYTCTCYGNRIECDPDSKSTTPSIHSGKGLSPSQQMAPGIFGAMLQGVFSGMFDDLVSPTRPSIQDTLKKQQEEEFRKQQEMKKQALDRWLNLQAEAEANRRKEEAEKKAAGEKILAQTSVGGEGMEDYKLNGAWYFWLGKAYYASKQYKQAIANFDQAASMIPEDRQTLLNEFQRRSNAGQVRFWRQHLLAFIPPKSSCYFWLGNAYYWNGQLSEAVNSHKKAIELDPQGSTHYFVMLGASYRELKQYNKALAAVKRAIEIKPDDFAYGVLGSIYERQNKMDEAIAARKK